MGDARGGANIDLLAAKLIVSVDIDYCAGYRDYQRVIGSIRAVLGY